MIRSLIGLVKCFSSYNASWAQSLELMYAGVNTGLMMLAPTIMLIMIGSILPSSSTTTINNYDGLLSQSLIDSFSPYAAHTTSLSLQPTTSNVDVPYIGRMCACAFLSPVTFDIVFRQFFPILHMTITRLVVVLMSRKRADESAIAVVSQRIRSGRVKRRRGVYDLYFPPKDDKLMMKNSGKTIIPALFFFPGFGVDHTAYADVAARMSDSGIAVAVLSLEPFRLAHKALGGGIDDIRRLLRVAGEDISSYYGNDSELVIEWGLGGHSMGGYNSLQLAKDITNESASPSVIINKSSVSRVRLNIVVWAAGHLVDVVPNLRINKRQPLRVIVLNGSNDGIVQISPQKKRELLSRLPKSTTELRTIHGANHSGFASYDTASKINSSTFSLNGHRTITLEAQHEEACSQTVRFLLARYKK